MEKRNLIGLLPSDIYSWLETEGEPSFRAQQIFQWIYEKKADSFDKMSNLPLTLREKLDGTFSLGSSRVEEVQKSKDGTVKFLIRFPPQGTVETVLIPHLDHRTLCLSTQVGCPVGCTFCATGLAGFRRNLTYQEIVEEVWVVEKETGVVANNLVFMGMGEPLLNYENVHRALQVINSPEGFRKGARRITVSTVGIPDKIVKWGRDWPEVNLAWSMHAPRDELRSWLIPINKVYSLEQVLGAIKEYLAITHRRVTVEYTLWQEINDSKEDAQEVAKLLKNLLVHVNLIPGNLVSYSTFSPSSPERVKAFASVLEERGIKVTIRKRRGQDIQAACGELYRIYS
ncbi:MAG TPA: 23S rRNA (adenine(2503)-C(2))-methyltransferase RlmN [Candidatus Atribacteria bacterium]|nr:23S rRNA (adenine(2503)-C(2))-methyltransferase RlmN [Candidatus Atribacteria bacterium]